MDTSEDQPAAASSSGSDQPSASAVAQREPSTPADEESLLQAARWGQVDVVRRLLAAGVDPDTPQAYLVSAPDGWLSPTALMVACAQGWRTVGIMHQSMRTSIGHSKACVPSAILPLNTRRALARHSRRRPCALLAPSLHAMRGPLRAHAPSAIAHHQLEF